MRKDSIAVTPYSSDFYESISSGSLASAEVVVPLLMELLHPRSVVDLGCGRGVWLHAFAEHGVTEILGIDGAWIAADTLLLDSTQFLAHDLTTPLEIDQRFDLALSLEVAEHFAPSFAETFVGQITAISDVVLFSAAIPSQGGTDHKNERWQGYWATLFADRGFRPYDIIRPQIWHNRDVKFWYRQNCLIYANQNAIVECERLSAAMAELVGCSAMLSVVHPDCYISNLQTLSPREFGFKETLKMLPSLFAKALQRRRIQR